MQGETLLDGAPVLLVQSFSKCSVLQRVGYLLASPQQDRLRTHECDERGGRGSEAALYSSSIPTHALLPTGRSATSMTTTLLEQSDTLNP